MKKLLWAVAAFCLISMCCIGANNEAKYFTYCNDTLVQKVGSEYKNINHRLYVDVEKYDEEKTEYYNAIITFLEYAEQELPEVWNVLNEEDRIAWEGLRVPSLAFMNYLFDDIDEKVGSWADVCDNDQLMKVDSLRYEFYRKYGIDY